MIRVQFEKKLLMSIEKINRDINSVMPSLDESLMKFSNDCLVEVGACHEN